MNSYKSPRHLKAVYFRDSDTFGFLQSDLMVRTFEIVRRKEFVLFSAYAIFRNIYTKKSFIHYVYTSLKTIKNDAHYMKSQEAF